MKPLYYLIMLKLPNIFSIHTQRWIQVLKHHIYKVCSTKYALDAIFLDLKVNNIYLGWIFPFSLKISIHERFDPRYSKRWQRGFVVFCFHHVNMKILFLTSKKRRFLRFYKKFYSSLPIPEENVTLN